MAMTTEPQQNATQRGAIPVDSFANRLMLARAHAGHLSIREAADLCGLGRGAWTNWEKGARPADIIDIADLIAKHLGVDRDWLLFGGQLDRQEAGRSLRRPRGEGGLQASAHYFHVPDRTRDHPTRPSSRPRDTRPKGQLAATGPARSGYLPRPDRKKRDR